MEATFHQCITSKYLVGRELGSGTTSTVRVGYKIVDGNTVKQFALKMIQRKEEASHYKFPIDSKIEIKIMKGLNHPCLLKIHEVLKSDTDMVIVMDLASGGELFDLVHEHYLSKTLSESSTKIYFYQIVHCVNYLHSHKVCRSPLDQNFRPGSCWAFTDLWIVRSGSAEVKDQSTMPRGLCLGRSILEKS